VEPHANGVTGERDLLLVNPAAGGGQAKEVLPGLRTFANQRHWDLEICVNEDAKRLSAQAREAAAAGRKRILVLGGDGTLQLLVNALVDFPETVLGVIPAGGGNDLAASLGLTGDCVASAAAILDGEICQVDAVRVRTADGRERLYVGGGGVGLDAEAARHASGVYRNLRGRSRYLLSAVRALLGFHSVPVRIQMIGPEIQDIKASVLLVGILNTPSYGAGLYLAPEARTDDGKLDLVVLEAHNFVEVLALIPALAKSGELRTKRVQRFRVERVRIETEKPCRFHGDGEIFGETPVEVSVVPRAYRMLRAKRREAG
jgi:diacylglycerol kinase (ATP)